MSAEQQNNFNLSGKTKDQIKEYLREMVLDDIYIVSFQTSGETIDYDVTVKRNTDTKIALRNNNGNFPNDKKFIAITYSELTENDSIPINDNISITNIKKKIISAITIEEAPEISSATITIDDNLPVAEHRVEDISTSDSETSDEETDVPNFVIDFDDVMEEQVQAVDVLVQQNLSQWETQLSEEKRKSLISELLLEYYKKDKNISLLDIESQVFTDLNNNILHVDNDTEASEFKPYKQHIIDGKFKDTNIYPIVEDKKIFYSNQDILGDEVTNIMVLPKPVASITTDEDGQSKTGEVEIKIQLIKSYSNSSQGIDGYKTYISKMYEGGSIIIDDPEEEGEGTEVNFDNLYATHLPKLDEEIDSEYYIIDNQGIETEVYRNCSTENKCIIDPTQENNETNLINFIKRKTIPREYYINDIYDEKFIVDNRGNRKKDIRTCNGTNKTGDNLYILGNDDLRKSITKAPEKKDIYSGETLKVIGMFIQSPYSKFKSVLANNEYTTENNDKVYPKLYNDSMNLGNIGQKSDSNDEIEIITDITNFNYEDYDPSKNYFIYFNKDNKRTLSTEDYQEYINTLLPTTTQIVDIEIENLKKAENINDINEIINKYGTDFLHLSNSDVQKISSNVIKNIAKILEQKATDYILKYDKIALNNKFIEFNETIVKILYDIENTISNDDNFEENVFEEFNNRLETYIESLPNLSIIRLFAIKFLGNDSLEEELEDITSIKDHILDKIIEREGIIGNRSIIKQIINRPESFDSEISQFLESYQIVNSINLYKKLYLSNKNFTTNKINELAFLKQIKNAKFGGDEFISLLNLLNLYNIKQNIDNRLSDDISQDNLILLDEQYKQANILFEREKEQYAFYLDKCNSVKVKKVYNSLEEVLADNDKDIKLDKRFSYINDIVIIGLRLLKTNLMSVNMDRDDRSYSSNLPLDSELRKAISEKFMFLSNSEIDNYIAKWNKLTDSMTDESFQKLTEMSNNMNLDDFIDNNDYALLDSDKKYLFFRKSNKWISIDKETYSEIQKCYMYKLNLLDYSIKDIESICSVTDERSDSDDIDCIKIGDNYIPRPLYREYLNISKINKKRVLIAKLLEYKNSVNNKIISVKEHLNERIRQVHNKNIYATKNFGYSSEKLDKKLVYPPKKLRLLLQKTYESKDFDMRMESLFEFIDKYGLEYSINPDMKDTDEAHEHSAKWIYYDSNKIDVPICCKHYLDYKNLLFRSNDIREKVINDIREKWSNGQRTGEYHICSNCGEAIDNIKYSEFEGFGKDNKVINFREKVSSYEETGDSFTMPSVILAKKTSDIVLNLLVTKLGISLRENDYNFIINQMVINSENMFNIKQFFTIIYKSSDIINKDLQQFKDMYVKKFKTISAEQYGPYVKSILIDFIENYDISTGLEYKTSMETFMKSKSEANDKKVVKLIHSKLMSKIKYHYDSYRSGEILNNILANLSQILIYSLPAYKLISLGAERREKKSGFFVQNLFKNPELAIPMLYNKIIQEKDATRSQPELTNFYNQLNDYFKNILDISFSRTLVPEYSVILNKIIDGVRNTSYISDIIINRSVENISQVKSSDTDYTWTTFLPPLKSNNDLTPESLNLTGSQIEDSIVSYNTNEAMIMTKQAEILDMTSSDVIDQEKLNLLKDNKHQLLAENNNIIHRLNTFYSKLGFLYMSIINRIIFDIDNSPYNISSYASSLGFDKLDSKYTDYFNTNYPSEKTLIQNIESSMKKIDQFTNSINNRDNTLDLINMNHIPRNLQSYMTFNKDLYKNEEDIKKYLMKQLKLINSITILDDEGLKYKKRYYRVLMDEDYKLYIKFLLNPINNGLSASDIELAFISYFKSIRDIDLSKDPVKKELLLRHKGYALIDIVSKKFKTDIEKSVETLYAGLNNDQLFDELNRLNTEFNKSSIIDKTVTYPMINNLIPFKYNIDKSLNDMTLKYIESVGIDILTEYDVDESVSENMRSILFNGNINTYIQNVELARGGLVTFSLASIQSLESLITSKNYFKNSSTEELFMKLVNIDSNKLLNNKFFEEIKLTSDKFTKISYNSIDEIQQQIKFNKTLISVNEYNSDINTFANILTIIISFVNRIKNMHVNPQSKTDMKLHVKLDNTEDNLFFYGSSIYKEKLDNLTSLSEIFQKRLQEGESLEFLDILPETSTTINILRDLLSLNKKFNIHGDIVSVNVTIPSIIRIYLHDLIIFYLNSIFTQYDSEINTLLYNVRVMLINEITNYLYTINRTDADIQQTIKTKRAKENIYRKNAFDRMSGEMRETQKLFRRFNIGTIFTGYAEEEVDINTMVMNGEDMAETDRQYMGLDDEGIDALIQQDLAFQEEYGDTEFGMGAYDQEAMGNIYGDDD